MEKETQLKIAKESRQLGNIMAELREVHGDPVAESAEMAVFRDEYNHEHGDIAHEIDGVSQGDVSEWMHEKAREIYDRPEATGVGDPWSVADPVVVLKD